ncbi:MAG: hypothetical protein JSV96_14680 [Candidatus Aminicenantes bacterium]|nr:MAG: hypothetical protein JSV96_14680 [Candidatus Aminicenantes bacterium]
MKNKRTKAWELERYLLGELPRQRMEEIAKLVQEDPELKKEIEQLKQSNQSVLEQYPAESMIPQIIRRYERGKEKQKEKIRAKAMPFSLRRLIYAAPVLVAALILLIVVFNNDRTVPMDTRIKGLENIDMTKTQIIIYRKKDDEAEILRDRDLAKAGDLLQIAYVPAGTTFGVIFSIDGNRVVTLHYPENTNSSAILKQEKTVLLGAAYELDDAPEFERFFFITAVSEINVQNILKEAKILADSLDAARKETLALPETYSQFTILLKKGEER